MFVAPGYARARQCSPGYARDLVARIRLHAAKNSIVSCQWPVFLTMAAGDAPRRQRRYPVCITLDHHGACEALDDWERTQATNNEPGDGSPAFFEFLEELGDRFPDAIVSEDEDQGGTPPPAEDEIAPCAAGPPGQELSHEEEDLLYAAWMAWCRAIWGDPDASPELEDKPEKPPMVSPSSQ